MRRLEQLPCAASEGSASPHKRATTATPSTYIEFCDLASGVSLGHGLKPWPTVGTGEKGAALEATIVRCFAVVTAGLEVTKRDARLRLYWLLHQGVVKLVDATVGVHSQGMHYCFQRQLHVHKVVMQRVVVLWQSSRLCTAGLWVW